MSHYIGLYSGDANSIAQTGGGLSDIQIYRGPRTLQGGAGLGKYFTTAFRYLRPLINSGVNALTDQGVKSASSVLSQLGKKDLKTILNEERQRAFDNLSTKAINKLNKINTQVLPTDQTGSGIMPFGLSPIQLQRLQRRKPKKSIKTRAIGRKSHSSRKRKVATTNSSLRKTRRQIGRGRKKKKTQIGSGRRRIKRRNSKKKKRIQKPKLRQLDIFT